MFCIALAKPEILCTPWESYALKPATNAMEAMDWKQRVARTASTIMERRLLQPKVAIVLGSGLGGLADAVQHAVSIDYSELDVFPQTHAQGHAGQLITGYLSGVPVVLMKGRSHRYEGYSDNDLALPILCLSAIGAQTLIVTNAVGGLNPRFRVGELMLIDQHIDFLWERAGQTSCLIPPLLGADLPGRGNPPYDRHLRERAVAIAMQAGIAVHIGTYLSTLGPTYETRGEYRMFRDMGADAVGMSTVPEVLAAARARMRVLAISVITNVAMTDVAQGTNHAEVVDCGHAAAPRLRAIVEGLLSEMAGQPD